MTNRISQHWVSVEALFKASSQDAFAEADHLAASPVSDLQPLEVYLDRTYLKNVVEVSVQSMQTHARATGDERVRRQLRAEVARRRAFVKWLVSRSAEQVYVRLYPAAEFPQPEMNGTDHDEYISDDDA